MTEEEKKVEYKKEQQKNISALKVGASDINGYHITKVFARGDEYVIYEIESKDLVESVKVNIDNVTETDESGIIKRYNSIRVKFVEIKGLLYKVVDKTTIKTIIAQILAHGLTEKPEEANTQFDNLKAEINKEYKDQFANRLRLLFSSLSVALIFIVIAVLTHYNKWFNDYTHIKYLIFVTTAGSIGGFFSLSIGLKKIICEKDVNKCLYLIYGAERIVIAVLASTIIYFAIKSDVLFGTCNKMDNPLIGYILFSFLAGFSETLVPSLMTKLEKE
jgi:hypothetical protein